LQAELCEGAIGRCIEDQVITVVAGAEIAPPKSITWSAPMERPWPSCGAEAPVTSAEGPLAICTANEPTHGGPKNHTCCPAWSWPGRAGPVRAAKPEAGTVPAARRDRGGLERQGVFGGHDGVLGKGAKAAHREITNTASPT